MRKYFFAVIALFSLLRGYSQQNYAVSAIDKSLLNRTGAVIRNKELIIQVKAPDDVIYKGKTAITVLNSSGDDEGEIVMFYDKTNQIKFVKGVIYNEFGLPVGKFTEKNFKDYSAVGDGSLYQDDRVKVFSPASVVYPYTIEYEYETRARHSFYFPEWRASGSSGVAVERSSLQFNCPSSFKLRYKELNYNGQATVRQEKETTMYRWEVRSQPSLREEPYSPDPDTYITSVKLAPEDFAYRGVKGSFKDWAQFGQWLNNNLLKGRDVLPETTVNYVRELVKDIADPKLKAQKIYEYMQGKTRYISVQIGIGGWQPYSASEVDRLGYGDCKGLVNYMMALLRAAGIESYYSIVHAGDSKNDLTADFAALQGNHVILCVPFENDTTWLECTSKTQPFGHLGSFTDDRLVLACTPEGGKLMRTPLLKAEDNTQIRKANFTLTGKGDLEGNIETKFQGSQYDNHDMLFNEPFKEQIKHLAELYPLPNLSVQSLEFLKDKGAKPLTTEVLKVASPGYGRSSGGRMYLSVNTINRWKGRLPDLRTRVHPVRIQRGFIDEDEYIYHLPADMKIDTKPDDVLIDKPFGKYMMSVRLENNKLTYRRVFQLKQGNYPAELYKDLVTFYLKVEEADRSNVVLVN